MSVYTAVSGQNMYDVCLITYGSLDFVVKLANDNGISDLNNINLTGILFTYDNTLVVNQVLQQQLNKNYGTAYANVTGSGGDYDPSDYSLDEYYT